MIEAALRMFHQQEGEAQSQAANPSGAASAEEVIDGPLSALMEIAQDNPLFEELGIEAQKLVGQELDANDDTQPEKLKDEVEEMAEAAPDLDVFETGVYLCRWPNGECSMVVAGSRRDALIQLDECSEANPAWLAPMESCMVDFKLNEGGELELGGFGEDTEDIIWERCYPELRALLSREDVVEERGGNLSDQVKREIRKAVEHERTRLCASQAPGPDAETETGKKLQKEMEMAGPVADFHVRRTADRILRSKRGKGGKPN